MNSTYSPTMVAVRSSSSVPGSGRIRKGRVIGGRGASEAVVVVVVRVGARRVEDAAGAQVGTAAQEEQGRAQHVDQERAQRELG